MFKRLIQVEIKLVNLEGTTGTHTQLKLKIAAMLLSKTTSSNMG